MTEAEWLTCGDPEKMLSPFPMRASVRTVRLLAAACCRSLGSMLGPSTHIQRDAFLCAMERNADCGPPKSWVDAVTEDAECAQPFEEIEGCSEIAEFYFLVQHGGLAP